MFGLSFGEILFLGALALVVVGPKQLPELARNLGRFMNDLKRATEGLTTDLKNHAKIDFELDRKIRRDQEDLPLPAAKAPDVAPHFPLDNHATVAPKAAAEPSEHLIHEMPNTEGDSKKSTNGDQA